MEACTIVGDPTPPDTPEGGVKNEVLEAEQDLEALADLVLDGNEAVSEERFEVDIESAKSPPGCVDWKEFNFGREVRGKSCLP